MRNERRVGRSTLAVITIAAIMLIAAAMTSMATTDKVFAYTRNQATGASNDCGNGEAPTNIGCQNTDCQIQGDENSCALTSQQTFPSTTPTTGTLTVIKEVRCIAIPVGTPCPVAMDFLMRVTVNNVLTDTFAGEPAPGTQVDIEPGTYFVSETSPKLPQPLTNTASASIDCEGTISAGESKTCTITNTISVEDIIR
jgi:hypothetical protein